ncbi:2-amino-4-hydroxy-6-hydroxymethyldihydropteridine pyrophosphokinase [Leptolyngbya valderiana BDU 20041]|uniref:2-amino-4-hydroxy-6- hydroxymethyldihydropteridine diphosphokinase n=1 Tax=Baaleninema simplex TaxID=2862350 RepID=UPI00034AABE6|nr:2-amino-4-hydroxy-6-hydroxymethyldihydropteridine diphosphokinase [Baaleninema simplex]OAB57039.1 2-amino-4-hydroxy-6-hydroxymethyldihydropteridine pyrophosphokinase [Leptolyngbya valderiana BDU 20041]
MAERAAIALGSNLGDSLGILTGALTRLFGHSQIAEVVRSPWYRTKPVGPPQPEYLNGCVVAEVTLSPEELLDVLLKIEVQFDRVRRQRWGPRTLDLDLIFYGDRVTDTPKLQLPHPRFRDRAFVLVPLADVAPHWLDPVSGQSVTDLLKAVDCSDVRLL